MFSSLSRDTLNHRLPTLSPVSIKNNKGKNQSHIQGCFKFDKKFENELIDTLALLFKATHIVRNLKIMSKIYQASFSF